MTLSIALGSAVSGLRAATAQTELLSNNVSNALTEDYARRGLALSSGRSGVTIDGVDRATAVGASEARRLAAAAAGSALTISDALARLAEAIGEPGEADALATRADALDAALAAAADTPESDPLLADAVYAAEDYAGAINDVAQEGVTLRTEADASIARQVADLNDTLSRIDGLNEAIAKRTVSGGDTSTLEDQRDALISKLSAIVPVKVVKRAQDAVALFTANGAQLIDGKVFEFGFTQTTVATPERTVENGGLSSLTLNGVEVAIGQGAGRGLLDGGSLSAAFELRDGVLPEIIAGLDDLAADLVGRTQGLVADPTLTPGDAGLFTDGGGVFDPSNLSGLSLRVSVNAAVDPDKGGEIWRLRDGMAAAVEGEAGGSFVLRGLQDAFGDLRDAPMASLLAGSCDAAGFAASLSALLLSRASSAETEAGYQASHRDELAQAELGITGVDTDQELSRLLVVEQAYAANARVVSAVDEMLQILTNL